MSSYVLSTRARQPLSSTRTRIACAALAVAVAAVAALATWHPGDLTYVAVFAHPVLAGLLASVLGVLAMGRGKWGELTGVAVVIAALWIGQEAVVAVRTDVLARDPHSGLTLVAAPQSAWPSGEARNDYVVRIRSGGLTSRQSEPLMCVVEPGRNVGAGGESLSYVSAGEFGPPGPTRFVRLRSGAWTGQPILFDSRTLRLEKPPATLYC